LKTIKRLLGFIALSIFFINAAFAQSIIEEVKFLNDLSEPVEVNIELKSVIRSELDSDNLMLDVNALKEKLPNFQNIVTTVNPIQGQKEQIEIIFEFQMKRTIRNIRILSNAGLELPTNIREKLLLQRESLFDARNLKKDIKTMTEHFVKQGFPKTEVEHEIQLSSDQTDVSLTYMIKPTTAKLIITELDFVGNKTFDRSKLKSKIESKPRGFFLSRHTVFLDHQLEADTKELVRFYKEAGFFDAEISSSYDFFHDGETKVTFQINEGKRYQVKEIELVHSELYPEEELQKIVRNNKMKFYSDKKLRKVIQEIRQYFGNKGHARVQVLASWDEINERVIIRVIEGEVFYIRNVIVEGNEKLNTRKVLLDVKIKAGQVFSAERLEKTLKQMKETGFYSDVRVDFDPIAENQGNISIVVKEARTRTISFGAGTGTNGIMGELSFSDRNFLNSGKSVSLHLRRTLEMTKIGLVYRDPHLFESDYAFKAGVNYKDDSRDGFNEERYGAILMIEKKLTENLKYGVGTRIEFLNLSDIDEEIRSADVNADGEDRIIGLVGTLFYKVETRDAAGDVKDGIRVKMALLPSYADQGAYVKTFATAMATKSLHTNANGVAHTISGRMTVGYASENTPFYEKFYAGGASTLRGYKRKSIRTEDGDGGQVLVSGSVSYSFPIWQETVKGVVFLEAASVGDSFEDLGDFRAVGGLGVRANLMDTFLGGMIEAGVAIPLKKHDGDELRPFYFIFGDYDPSYDL
jgi:outer membrane protein insertion porin family